LNAILEEREAEMEAAGEFFVCEDELCQYVYRNEIEVFATCQFRLLTKTKKNKIGRK
jgi:hypothetical protein